MAKVRTTAHEDDLSVIAEELKLVQQIVRDLKESTSSLTRNQAAYQQTLEKERTESARALRSVISQETALLHKVKGDIVSLDQRAQENIRKTSLTALQEVRDAVLVRNRTSKQMAWMLGICGILVALVSLGFLINRNLDQSIVTSAIQEKARYESLMLELKQWAKENPRDAKSFRQWTQKRLRK